MSDFKKGNRVRLRIDGDIGIHNKLIFPADYLNMEKFIWEIDRVGKNGDIRLTDRYSCKLTVTEVQIELVPEMSQDFKIGDWVELSVYSGHMGQISDICMDDIEEGEPTFKLSGLSGKLYFPKAIKRKLSPTEVVIDFGSGIKGTIIPCISYDERGGEYESIKVISCGLTIACIRLSSLNSETFSKVNSILKGIKEYRKEIE